MGTWHGILALAVLPALAWAAGETRGRVHWRIVLGGLALQVAIAAVMVGLPAARAIFMGINIGVETLQAATLAGTSFVFGYLGGGPPPFAVTTPSSSFILAFQALPLLLIVSALSAVLFHWRVLPPIIGGAAWLLGRTLGIGGTVGVATAANVFVGMLEAPLLIRPYLRSMSRGALFAVMTVGMATIAGTMFVVYATVVRAVVPDAAGHLLTASLMNAPAALAMAALMVPPEREPPQVPPLDADRAASTMEAVVRGAVDGMHLLINVVAMLVVMVALVALANHILGAAPDVAGTPLTLQRVLGWLAAPLAWLIGVPWDEAPQVGALLGTKVVLNEFLAYLDMVALPADALSPRSRLIVAYALCSFANLGSLGIMLGGLTTLVPERRTEIVSLGPRTILSGTLASCLSGAVIGLFVQS